MLLHLGHEGKLAVLSLINYTWQQKEIPKAWRNAVVSPILKKGKPQEDMSSYRPISVISCQSKLAERNTRLYWWLVTTETLSRNQAGSEPDKEQQTRSLEKYREFLMNFRDEI